MNLNHLLAESCSCLFFVDRHIVGAQEDIGRWRRSLTAQPWEYPCESSPACGAPGFPRPRKGTLAMGGHPSSTQAFSEHVVAEPQP